MRQDPELLEKASSNLAKIRKNLKSCLGPERFTHSLRVEKLALQLARIHQVNPKQARIAGLLHDCARKYHRPRLLYQARKFGLKIDPIREFEPKLLHAELSAVIAKKEYGVRDPEILKAIAGHTVGKPAMSKLSKIVYLADHIEEERTFRGIKKVRSLAYKDLDQALMASISCMLKYLLDQELPIHEDAIKTRNYYLLK